MKNKTSAIVITTAVIGTLLIGGTTASAQTTGTSQAGGWGRGGAHMERAPGVRGTVTAVSGNIITITSKGFGQNAVATTYTVDATSATFTKNGATATRADIAVGDMISAQGTLTGTNLVATTVFDGKGGMGKGGRGMMGGRGGMRGNGSSTLPMIALPQGNGQPVVGGVVATISGTTFTLSNKGGASFTIDGTSATVTKAGASSTLANIAVGDTVVVQGTVNGSAITATTIMDHGIVSAQQAAVTQAQSNQPAQRQGFMGMLGGFFGHLFGF